MEHPNIIQEEIKTLQQKLAEKQAELAKTGNESRPEAAAKEVIKEYASQSAQTRSPVLQPAEDRQIKSAAQKLKDEPHAKQVEELLSIAKKNGILNAVEVVKHLKNPHLLDDFHDRLVLELLNTAENKK